VVLKTKFWAFVNLANGEACLDVRGASKKELIEKAKEKFGKSDAEIRSWAKNKDCPSVPKLITLSID
jgi:hypothetical protein